MNAPFVAIRLAARTRAGQRLARHLWRMCFALFIAAGSFFSIRERVTRVFPEPFTTGRMRALPILLLFGTMFYWLWRVRRRTPPVLVRYDSTPLPSEVTLAASFGMPYIDQAHLGGMDEPVAEIVPNTQPQNFALCFQRFAT